MNLTGFEPSKSHTPHWRDWSWQAHPLMWAYPAALLVTAAPLGARGLSIQTARLLCWLSALGLQVLLCPRRPLLFEADDPSSRMRVWPLGLWHDGYLSNLWRLSEDGSPRIFRPVLGNVVVVVAAALILGVSSVQMTWNPFAAGGPWNLDGQEIPPWSGLWWLGQIGQAHWILALAAIVPAMPLAGGLGLAMLLDRIQWRDQDARRVRRIISWASIAFLGLLGTMLVANERMAGYCVILVALVLAIEARKQARRDATEEFIENFVLGVIDEEDFEAGLERLDKPGATLRSKARAWLRNQRIRRSAEAVKAAELRRVQNEERLDRVLTRIHESGYGSISRSDRWFLKRIAREYRERRDDHAS